jgi:adenine deaminase
MVRRALDRGYDFWSIMMAACVNAQRHYKLDWGLLQEGDEATFIAVDSLNPHFRVLQTVIKGTEVFDCNTSFVSVQQHHIHLGESRETYFPNRFEAKPIKTEDISLDMSKQETLHVIRATDGSLYSGHDTINMRFNTFDSSSFPWSEVQKIVVLNRYQPDAKPAVGLVRGFELTHGAIASSVAHDSHNIVAIGANDDYLVKAINRVIEMGGGLVAMADNDMEDLALPIAGLMSPLNGHEVAYHSILLREMARRAGCPMRAPFITMSFLCLPVIPELKITDKHLWDSQNMKVIE